MSYERAGRSDKFGNLYEGNWAIQLLLDVLEERIQSITLEDIGEAEKGVDIWIEHKDGHLEGQQCKGRCDSADNWTFARINTKGIVNNWITQLSRDDTITVSLVSPLSFVMLLDLIQRAKNTNGNPDDFLNYQIKQSGAEVQRAYKEFCTYFKINSEMEEGTVKAINYLQRMSYHQVGDLDTNEYTMRRISILFHGDSKTIFNQLLGFLQEENIYGEKLTIAKLTDYLNSMGIEFRDLSKDERIMPRILELNEEFKNYFYPLTAGLFEREEANRTMTYITEGQSVLIHGKAGAGKSGCVENIINACKDSKIPYLAIKLDKRIPCETTEKWGASMGLPDSPSHCLNAIAGKSNSVLILDQLDALRWTQAHSGTAISICRALINEVSDINRERKGKISIVFVSRTYDYVNDRGIKSLFEDDEKKDKWKFIQVKELSENEMKKLIGDEYGSLSPRMRALLRYPNNIYIWQHLDRNNQNQSYNSTGQLVAEWWSQIQLKSGELSEDVQRVVQKVVTVCYESGRITIPHSIITADSNGERYLQSSGLIVSENNQVSFVHQSILDAFLSARMLEQYLAGDNCEKILGSKERQIPSKRYQLQLLLEQLIDYSENEFISFGEMLISSSDIRWSFKYTFFEQLAVFASPSVEILECAYNLLLQEEYEHAVLNTVYFGHKQFVDDLLSRGLLKKWSDNAKSEIVINLLYSISREMGDEYAKLISTYLLKDEEEAKRWYHCLGYRLIDDSDEIFKIRYQACSLFPELLSEHIDISDIFSCESLRGIMLLALMVKANSNNGRNLYIEEERQLAENSGIYKAKKNEIIDILLPLIPEKDNFLIFSEWSDRHSISNGVERACVQILKKANEVLAAEEPDHFLKKYENFRNTGCDLYNEIYLNGLVHLPDSYADEAIDYLTGDVDNAWFEETSGNGDKMMSAIQVVNRFAPYTSDEIWKSFEETVNKYISPNASEILRDRINTNKEKKGYYVFWRFWGEFQKNCFSHIDGERLSEKAKKLLNVLERRDSDWKNRYCYDTDYSGASIVSPVSGKELPEKDWEKIITNRKITEGRTFYRKNAKGCYVESSREMFSSDFSRAVSANPDKFIDILLADQGEILPEFIDAFFRGIAYNETLLTIDISVLETLIFKYGYDYESQRAMSYCRIIEKRKDDSWSTKVYKMLIDIAEHHKNPEEAKANIVSRDDPYMHLASSLEMNAINSVRSEALRVIGEVLWSKGEMLNDVKALVEKASEEENLVVQYASMYVLYPAHNLDAEWADPIIIKLYLRDIRNVVLYNDRKMLFILRRKYHDEIAEVVQKCFKSEDERLEKIGAYTLCEMHMLYGEFGDEILDFARWTIKQKQYFLEMCVTYFGIDKYREQARLLLLQHVNDEENYEFPYTKLFYEKKFNLDYDLDMIESIVVSKCGKRIFHAFCTYIQEVNLDIMSISSLVINSSKALVSNSNSEGQLWLEAEEITKLLLELIDRTSNSCKTREKEVLLQCLDLWDLMYINNTGVARNLTQKLMERE